LLQAGEYRKLLADPKYVRARPILDQVELFDADFFGFSPREAEVLDPQLRLFLEGAWTALEHAGHDTERFKGRVSLFAGSAFGNYLVHNLYKNRPVMEAFGDQQTTIYNVQDSVVTMVGYKLNLRGVCCAVQTFCSTSLVAVHLACQNLLNYESDLALAGGVTVYVPQKSGYLYEEGGILSRDGHCRTFDARADGTVFGNGLGVVILRRLEDALKDGDTIHAVIRGSAVNNDGSRKVSYAAPGVVGQTEVVVGAAAGRGERVRGRRHERARDRRGSAGGDEQPHASKPPAPRAVRQDRGGARRSRARPGLVPGDPSRVGAGGRGLHAAARPPRLRSPPHRGRGDPPGGRGRAPVGQLRRRHLPPPPPTRGPALRRRRGGARQRISRPA